MMLDVDRKGAQRVFLGESVDRIAQFQVLAPLDVLDGLMEQQLPTLGRQTKNDQFGMLIAVPKSHRVAGAGLVDHAKPVLLDVLNQATFEEVVTV